MKDETILAFGAGILFWMIIEWLFRWYEERH